MASKVIDGEIVSPAVGYRLEGSGTGDDEPIPADAIDDPFDLSDNDFNFFQDNFIDKPHTTYLCSESTSGPVAVSVVVEKGAGLKALVRTRAGNERVTLDKNPIKVPFFRKLFGMGPTPASVIKAVDPKLPGSKMKPKKDPRLTQALLNLEEKQTIKGFKFGILYAAEGQTKEDEMFANVDTSPEFEQFCDFLGDRVQLDGWTRFRGGLDVKNGSTGEVGLFTEWNNNEIMYHVSTLLPFNPKDKQQLERKRHIGNDIVVIVWQDGDTVYRPTTISSRQVHVVFLVKRVINPDDPDTTYYRVCIVSKDGVPHFGPPLKEIAVYKEDDDFRELFYRKLLNAEKACYAAPMLHDKLTRTRTALIKDIAETFGA